LGGLSVWKELPLEAKNKYENMGVGDKKNRKSEGKVVGAVYRGEAERGAKTASLIIGGASLGGGKRIIRQEGGQILTNSKKKEISVISG